MVGLERAVRRRAAAARVGVVDDVIVDERCGMEDLQRAGGGEDRLGRCRRSAPVFGDGPPAGDAEAGAQTLSA